MALYDPAKFNSSKENDKKLVKWLVDTNRCNFATIATSYQDKVEKFDISVVNLRNVKFNIDTKYTTRNKTNLFYEFKKHENSKANFIWYINLNDLKHTFLVKTKILRKLAKDGRPSYIKYKDPLVDFSIDELVKDVDYYVRDISDLSLV